MWKNTDLYRLISRIESGGRPKGGASEDSGDIPSLGGENIRQLGGLDLDSVKKVPLAFFERMPKGILEPDDVLINKDGANTGKVGLYECQFNRASINEHLFRLRGYPERLTQRFLYYLLLSPIGQSNIRAKISGSAQPGLKRGFIRDFPVHVPASTTEQSRIADVLATIDRAIEQTEALIAKYRRVKTGLMHDLLTRGIDENGKIRDPETNPKQFDEVLEHGLLPVEWAPQSLRNVGKWLSGGTPYKGVPKYWNGGDIPWVSPKDMKSFCIKDTIDHVTELGANSGTSQVPANAVLLVVRGMILAHSLPVAVAARSVTFNQDMKAIITHQTILPQYLGFWFVAHSRQLLSLVTESTHGTKRFDLEELLEYPIALPTIAEQRRICAVLDAQDRRIHLEEICRDKLERIRQGLMQDLLTGKVSVAPLLSTTQEHSP